MSKKRPSSIPEDQWIEDLPSYVSNAAYEYLPLNVFGFQETYRDDTYVILNSEWCRIDLHSGWEMHPYNHREILYELSVYYGRLHAPNQISKMEWNSEECECWLHLSWNHVLEFINKNFPRQQRPASYGEANKRISGIEMLPNEIHRRLAVEAEIWKHYTPELFELFDLRHPELWEQYRAWLKACYIAEGRNEAEDEKKGFVPYYRVC